ncbi:MAG: hypothetical protein EOO77_11455 [Oxalobacteraceae bacterium]|nr:MAG: hypothetical protein EOO77_11455 [Oxalobacteraceae bacterium]
MIVYWAVAGCPSNTCLYLVPMKPKYLIPAAFFAGGLVMRLILQHVETRWQMAACAAIALSFWIAKSRATLPLLLSAGAAGWLGILIAKFSIEGVPLHG